jgi:hypothetical protein
MHRTVPSALRSNDREEFAIKRLHTGANGGFVPEGAIRIP